MGQHVKSLNFHNLVPATCIRAKLLQSWPTLWPIRPLCPWDSPGKNTGVGCHALFQGNLPDPDIELASLTISGIGRQVLYH